MEKLKSKETPFVRSYYITEEENEQGEKELVVGSKGEYGVAYYVREIIDDKGNMHIIFWKTTNSTQFEDSKRTFVFG